MNAIADRYRRLAGAFTETVAAVPADRWGSPSPCEEWTARDIVRHVVDTHGMFLGLADRGFGDIPSVDHDPLAAWSAARDGCWDPPDSAVIALPASRQPSVGPGHGRGLAGSYHPAGVPTGSC